MLNNEQILNTNAQTQRAKTHRIQQCDSKKHCQTYKQNIVACVVDATAVMKFYIVEFTVHFHLGG